MDNSKMAARGWWPSALPVSRVGVDGQGALIRNVPADSPAQDILAVGDVVVVAGGRSVSTKDDPDRRINFRAHRPGDRLPLEVRRDDGHPLAHDDARRVS